MMARANPTMALRPYLPADAALLAAIFRASIEELTAEDYSEAQQRAWAAAADDETDFAARLAGALTLIATLDGSPVGFVAVKDNSAIDMLYVHPAVSGQGVGAMLCDAAEKLTASRGAKKLVAEASDSALGFFQKRGYSLRQRNTVPVGEEWLGNTTVEKQLVKAEVS